MSRAAEPLAVVSFDRRKGINFGENEDEQEQWEFDGATIKRVLNEDGEADWQALVQEAIKGTTLPPGVTRFVLYGRFVYTRDYWGECDAWYEDLELVPLGGWRTFSVVVGNHVTHMCWPDLRDKMLRTLQEMEAKERDRELRHACRTTKLEKEDDASSR